MSESSHSAYRDLVVWQKSMEFANSVIDLTEQLETERKHYRLVEQLEASAASVPMNIAEGKGRFSRKEFRHFLFIARGSLYETMTLLDIFRMRAWIQSPAFDELEQLGWLEKTKRPRMVSVQAEGCAPVVKAFQAKASFCDFWTGAYTIASGLRVPKSFADHLILQDLYDSDGIAIAVSDEAILESQKHLASQEGIFAAPEGAATLAALNELIKQNWIHPEEQIVLFNTGSGLKYLKPG